MCDPLGGLIIYGEDLFRERYGSFVQRGVALADAADGPVDGFPDEVARIGRAGGDEGKSCGKEGIGRVLIVHCQAGDHDIARAADELSFVRCPFADLLPGEGGFIE